MHTQSNLTEQELLNDALTSEKQMLNSYGTFIAEATCKNLRDELNKIISETQQVQFDMFNAMKTKGWYPVKNANISDVQQVTSKFEQVKQTLA